MKKLTCLLLLALLLLSACAPGSSSVSLQSSSLASSSVLPAGSSQPAPSSSAGASSSGPSLPELAAEADSYWRSYGDEKWSLPETGVAGTWVEWNIWYMQEDGNRRAFYFLEDHTFLYREVLRYQNDKVVCSIAGSYSFENDHELHLHIETSYQNEDGKEIVGGLDGTTTVYSVYYKGKNGYMSMIHLTGYAFNPQDARLKETSYGLWEASSENFVGTWQSPGADEEEGTEEGEGVYEWCALNWDGSFRYELREKGSNKMLNFFAGTYKVVVNDIIFTVTVSIIHYKPEQYAQFETMEQFTTVYYAAAGEHGLSWVHIKGSGPYFREDKPGNFAEDSTPQYDFWKVDSPPEEWHTSTPIL